MLAKFRPFMTLLMVPALMSAGLVVLYMQPKGIAKPLDTSQFGRLDLESLANEVIDAPTLDYDTEISREKSNSRKAKDERFRGRGNPDSKKPIFELPQGIEPLPSNVHWWIGLPALPVDQSDVIVLGKVVERTAHLTDDRTGIYSEFALQVEDVFKDKSGSVKSSEPLVANRAGGNVRFASGKVQRYVISKQGMPLKGSRYVLFLRSTSEGDLTILTGFELRNELVIPLDGDTPDVRVALPFAKYRNLGDFLFLAELHEALANSNLELLGDTSSQALQVLAVDNG